ncbi:hypothetical protein DV515_00013064 [Chloebia gouldiae]|uniref:Uncharacterized protein n=1 Tax=Chloebia gouldiae TaxID=44316 RepID=A0A3L8S1Y6_CHLGU|nr:hypothetical protein DV515_00013064 [Chloebia gouldiae]
MAGISANMGCGNNLLRDISPGYLPISRTSLNPEGMSLAWLLQKFPRKRSKTVPYRKQREKDLERAGAASLPEPCPATICPVDVPEQRAKICQYSIFWEITSLCLIPGWGSDLAVLSCSDHATFGVWVLERGNLQQRTAGAGFWGVCVSHGTPADPR